MNALRDASPAAGNGFLPGGGEMGALMRAHDWSATSLGPPGAWPRSLRTLVATLLQCQLPMYVAWGPELLQFYNDAYRPILGNKHPALGRPTRQTWPEIWPRIGPIWEEVLAGRPIGFQDHRLTIERFGYPEDCYFNLSYSPVHDDDGAVAGVLVTFAETTQQVASERRLRFLDELTLATRALDDPEAVMRVAAERLGRHLGANRCAYANVLADQDTFDLIGDYNDGVPSIVGRYRFTDFGHAVHELMLRDQPYVNHDVDSDPRTAGTELAAYRLTRIQSVICVPLHKEGRFVAGMAVHQATPRRWSPEETDLVRTVVDRCWEALDRIRSSRGMADANRRLQLALEAGGLGDWSWDAASDVVVLADRAADLFGLPHGEPVTWAAMRALLHEDDREHARLAVEQALQKREQYSIEYRVLLGGGNLRWISAQGTGVYRDDGTVAGMIGVVQDTTTRQQAAQERKALLESERAARTEAERASTLKDEFLATLSHELRTPLSAILGWVHILRRKLGDAPPDVAKGVDVIERSTRIQVQLIDDLLDMSRITSGKLRLETQPVAPITFVQAAADVIRPTADAQGVALLTAVEPTAAVIGDAGRLQQVVWNLLANAVKFTPRGGRVRVALRQVGMRVRITVEDSGVGIKPEFLPHLFERFRQGDGSITRRFGGLGLGLSIVRHLVELHGGTVAVESGGEGCGALFTIELPVIDHAGSGTGWLRSTPTFPAQPQLDGARILVVDDEADARDLLRRLLEECGAQVQAAADAAAALEQVQAFRPDLVVSDIGMPGLDGYEMLRRLRALPPERGGLTLAIALTAFARPEDRQRALETGFVAHVPKPLEPAEVLGTVARVLGRRSCA